MAKAPFGDLLLYLRKVCGSAAARDLTDAELLEHYRVHRDEVAVSVIVHRHGPMVLGVCRRVLGDSPQAEDAFQATFLVLVRRAASISRTASLGSWLYAVAQRIAKKARASEAVRRRRERQIEPMRATEPLDDVTWQEIRGVLDEEIAHLAEKYRAPLVLCYFEGKSYDQAARELGWSKSTLASRLGRGRELLRQQLVRRGVALSAGALATVLCEKVSGAPVGAMLIINTVKAAVSIAAGKAVVSGALSAQAIALAEEAMASMVGIKGKLIIMVLLLGLGGAGLAGHGALMEKGQPAEVQKGQPAPAKGETAKNDPPIATDLFGDPLPPGALNRLGSMRLRHTSGIGSMLYTPDGKALVSTDGDAFLRLWDAKTGKLLWRLTTSATNAVALSSDGKRLAGIGQKEFVLVETADGKIIVKHQWPKAEGDETVRGAAISSDLTTFACGCADGTVRVCEAATAKEKLRFVAVAKYLGGISRKPLMQFSLDARTLYVGVTQNETYFVRAFDIATGKLLRTQKIAKGMAYNVAVSADAQMLAALMWPENRQEDPFRVVLWDLSAGKQRHSIEAREAFSAAFSPDGNLLAVGGKQIAVFDVGTGKQLHRMRPPRNTTSLVFAPDGKTLAAANNGGSSITVWDLATGKAVAPSPEPTSRLGNVQFLAGGSQLRTYADDDGVYWWEVATGQLVRQLPHDPDWWGGQSFSPDGKLLATAHYTNDTGGPFLTGKTELILVDCATGQTVRTFEGAQREDFNF